MIKTRNIFIAVACLVMLVSCALVVGLLPIRNWGGEFSKEAWEGSRTGGYGWGVNDWKMADDLVASEALIGMTRDQVRGLLGEPHLGRINALEEFPESDYGDLAARIEAMVPTGSALMGVDLWLIREAGLDDGILFVIYDTNGEVVGALVYVI